MRHDKNVCDISTLSLAISCSSDDRFSFITPSQIPPHSPFSIAPLCCHKLVVTSSDYRF